MRLHVTKVMEWESLDQEDWHWDRPEDPILSTYADDPSATKRPPKAAESALVTRHCMPPTGRCEYHASPEIDLDWELYSIVVQSPLLRRALEPVLKYYSGDMPSYDSINISSDHMELRAPFKPFLKERLEDALQKEHDPETQEHLSLLCKVLEEDSSNANKMIKQIAAHGIVYFEDLPLILKPRAILFTIIEGQTQLLSLREWFHATDGEGQPCLDLTCTYIDWQGTGFGAEDVHTDLLISEFKGPMTITDLPVYPLVFHPNRHEVEQMLISRGKRFEAQKGYHYCAYDGIGVDDVDTIGPVWDNLDHMTHVNSRVIIDTAAFYKLHPDMSQRMKWFDPSALDSNDRDEMQLCVQQRAGKSLREEQLRFCAPTLRAYSVNDEKWLHIRVDDVKDIEWDDQAFNNLALPQEKKEMILAFANSQIRHEQNTGNVVQGKGNGVIVLCGPPGAGKTRTAEAIAEEMHAPLYTLSAGDLGLTTEEIELSLISALEFTAKWKAVLLLDDTDAFVNIRSTHEGQDKNLVPIYQRILEYYDSVLFLNTNHTGGIDAAFETRAHHSSHYHEPGKPYRRVGDIFKEAQSLAMEQNEPLSLEHVMTVAQSSGADDAGLSEGPFYTRYEVPNDQW